jgi:hypothetical protein
MIRVAIPQGIAGALMILASSYLMAEHPIFAVIIAISGMHALWNTVQRRDDDDDFRPRTI